MIDFSSLAVIIYVVTFFLSIVLYYPLLDVMVKNEKTIENIIFIIIADFLCPPLALLIITAKLIVEIIKYKKNERKADRLKEKEENKPLKDKENDLLN